MIFGGIAMLQVHSIILWAPARDEEFDSVAERAYAILTELKNFGEELSPNYLKVMRKKDAKPIELTPAIFKDILRKNINKEGKMEFPDLGYTVGFFSSLINKKSAGISMTIGVTNPKFTNTLTINTPQEFPVYTDVVVAENLVYTFKKCVEIFEPFWGSIVNNVNGDRVSRFCNKSLPTTTHWANFFGSDIVKRLGESRIAQAPVQNAERLGSGYFIRLKELPINDECEDDIKIQIQANSYFGFSDS